LQGLFIVINL